MASSYNGWFASPALDTRTFTVEGRAFPAGIVDNDNVDFVLRYIASEFHKRVEALVPGWNWGFNYRPSTGSSTVLSCHASGTAIDINAPQHGYGTNPYPGFTWAQIAEIEKILAECHGAVRWGGHYNGTKDPMHFEINVSGSELAVIVRRMKEEEDDEMKPEDFTRIREIVQQEIAQAEIPQKTQAAVWDREMNVTNASGKTVKKKTAVLLREVWEKTRLIVKS